MNCPECGSKLKNKRSQEIQYWVDQVGFWQGEAEKYKSFYENEKNTCRMVMRACVKHGISFFGG